MLVTLRRVSVSYFEDYGLRGFIECELEGGQGRTYSFRLPTPDEPDPPGWSSLSRFTQVETQAVIDGWDEAMTTNEPARTAALEVSIRYGGERFLATEQKQPDGSLVLDLTASLDIRVAAPKQLVSVAPQVDLVPARYSHAFHIAVESLPGESAQIVVSVADVDPLLWPRFKVPDKNDNSPEDWWFVECFTGISHKRVVDGWNRAGNPVLDDAVRILGAVIDHYGHVPLTTTGAVDVTMWRREMVRQRLGQGAKPFIFVGRPDHNIEHTKAIIYDAAGRYLFRANVEPGRSKGCPAMIMDSDGKATLQHLDDIDLMRGVLVRFIRFARLSNSRPPKPVNPSKELLADLIRYPDRNWPIIEGVVRIPTVRRDGSVITDEGYDRDSKLWYAPEFALEPVPDHPTQDDIDRARALLLTPIADFPFVSEGARTGALACLFEQIVRPMIHGPRPLYIFDAPEQGQGTGKTLLAKIFQVIITGNAPAISALGKREDEIEKRITTILRQNEPFIIFDNLTREITSEALQQLATSERWQARLLNTNDAPILPQNATFVLTLNGARANRDMARRVVLCGLDAKVTNAYERIGFRIPEAELITWVQERRASIIRACLILVRAWVNAGMPEDATVVRGSFGGWCKVMGGLLKHAGFGGLTEALKASSTRDVNVEDHRLLVRCWLSEYSAGQALPAITLGQLAQKNGLYDDRLRKGASPLSLGRAMANILQASLIGQTFDGYRVAKTPTVQNGYHTYTLLEDTTEKLN
ncbi:putative ATPase [Virus Rctr197k]|nr:putative ATPase [Virus Rctr197k]